MKSCQPLLVDQLANSGTTSLVCGYTHELVLPKQILHGNSSDGAFEDRFDVALPNFWGVTLAVFTQMNDTGWSMMVSS